VTCHGGTLAGGSPSTFVNGLEMGRCLDPVDCGSFVETCSIDTLEDGGMYSGEEG